MAIKLHESAPSNPDRKRYDLLRYPKSGMESLKGKSRGFKIKCSSVHMHKKETDVGGFVRPDKAIEGLDQPWQGRETSYHCSLYKRNHLSHLTAPIN